MKQNLCKHKVFNRAKGRQILKFWASKRVVRSVFSLVFLVGCSSPAPTTPVIDNSNTIQPNQNSQNSGNTSPQNTSQSSSNTSVATGDPVLTSLDKAEAESGEVIKIRGQFLNQNNFRLLFSVPNQGIYEAPIISSTENEITTMAPTISQDRKTDTVWISIKRNDDKITEPLSLNVHTPNISSVQSNMINQLQESFRNSGDVVSIANKTENFMDQLVAESTTNEEFIKKLDYALSSSIKEPEDVEKLILSLDHITQSKSFSSKSIITTGNNIQISNNIYYARNDSENSSIPNRISNACNALSVTDLIQKDDDLVILYINGLNTRSDQFCQTKIDLEGVVQEAGIKAKVSGMYQDSFRETQTKILDQCSVVDNAKKDELEKKWISFNQYVIVEKSKNPVLTQIPNSKLISVPDNEFLANTSALIRRIWNCNALQTPPAVGTDLLREAVRQRLNNVRPSQVYELAHMIETLLNNNKKVILIPHSQGNFFARQALEVLLEKTAPKLTGPGTLLPEQSTLTNLTKEQIVNSVGVLWLANPVEIQFPHTIRSKDLVCDDNTLEPTCHSYGVGIKGDVVAHLRFLSNTDLAIDLPIEVIQKIENFITGFLSIPPSNVHNLRVNQDYIRKYNSEMLNSPIVNKNPMFSNIDGGEAGQVNLGFAVHDINCSYLLDPQNPSGICADRLNKNEISRDTSMRGELPRTKILQYLKTMANDLKKPLYDEIDLRGVWNIEAKWSGINHTHKGNLFLLKKLSATRFSGSSEINIYNSITGEFISTVTQDVEARILDSSNGSTLVEIQFIGSNPKRNPTGPYSPDTYYLKWDKTQGNPNVLEGHGDDIKNQKASVVKLKKINQNEQIDFNFNGVWKGNGYQYNTKQTWRITLQINKNGQSLVDYPSLKCGGTLTLLEDGKSSLKFKEKITYGNCVDNGLMNLSSENGSNLRFQWFFSNGQLGADGSLVKE